ncbi:uncharacterized protein LOC143237031 isoform X2 [Tachypleus tridentatus]|uniref:uncharacterized protein LOC143237031 isoform X2 n=1 Tax=Tachypleus tridentatus TaxID=6853 RepID=UPI003FD5EA45
METAVTSELLGHQVQITTDDGIYKGLVKSFSASLMKLTLYKVFSCDTNKPLHGLHHFYEHEIKECLVLSEQQKKGKILKKHLQIPEVDVKSHKHFKDYEKNCGIKTRHLGQLNFLINCGITDDDVLEEAVRKADGKEDSDYTIHCKNKQIEPTNVPLSEEEEQHFQPPTLRFQLSADFVVIDEIGDSFFDAIGTRDYIFLFDIFSLGKQAFQQGLKEIMESLSILKVIHGCYLLSDVLFHQYDTNLLSVFDTQIGDVLVQRQENEKLQCRTRHLNSCLTDYLQLSDTDICVKWFSQDFLNKDNEVWKQRPLPPILHEAAVKHVIYLRELRVAVMEKLLTEFTSAVNSSLSLIRDMSHEELDNNAPFSVTVPLILSNFQSKSKRKASFCPKKFLPPGNVHQEDKFLSSFPSQKELNFRNYSTLWKSTNLKGKNHIHQKMEISNKKTNFERQWRKKQKCDEGRKTGCGKANKTLSSSSPSVTENQELLRTSEKGLSSKNGNIQQKEANVISNHTKMKKVSQPSVSESESPSSSQCVCDLKNLKISNKEEALPSQKQCNGKYFTLSSSNHDFVPLKDKPSDTVCNSEYGRYQKKTFGQK